MRVKIINDVVTWHTEIIASLIENVDNIVKKPCNEIEYNYTQRLTRHL